MSWSERAELAGVEDVTRARARERHGTGGAPVRVYELGPAAGANSIGPRNPNSNPD